MKQMADFSRVETHLKLAVGLVVFLVMIIRHERRAQVLQTNQEQTGQNVDSLRAELEKLKKTVKQEDKERDKKIAQLDANVGILLQRSEEDAKQVRLLREDIKHRRISEPKALRRIDTLDSDGITDFFKNLNK
jgi:predicted RNase H-like nuclease (RuvC/YqgF family)